MMSQIKLEFPWQFNTLQLYDFKRIGKLDRLFEALADPNLPEGGFAEFGVFRGRSLLSVAYYLKENNQDRNVYGFDSFAGFPEEAKHPKDETKRFEDFGDSSLLQMVREHRRLIELRDGGTYDTYTASISKDFSETNLDMIQRLATGLGLSNLTLVPGAFHISLPRFESLNPELKISAGIIDSDLYLGYTEPLEFFRRHLVVGGFVYLDEYFSLKFPGAKTAVDEFLKTTFDFELECWKDPHDSTWMRYGLRRIAFTDHGREAFVV